MTSILEETLIDMLDDIKDSQLRLSRLERRESRQRHIHGGKARELTIAAGVITVRPIDSHIECDTQADAGSDDLDTINGGIDGQMIVLHPVDNVRDIVVRHATGNIRIKGALDVTLAFRYEYVLLVYYATGGFWMTIE